MNWISVNDRLPDHQNETVIICTGGTAVSTAWMNYNDEWEDTFTNGLMHVTHWMPLPSPPKE